MYSSSVIFGLWIVCIAFGGGGGGHCDTLAFQPGISYSWIIPPQSQPSSQQQDKASATFDPRNESPITHIGGYGHPPFYLRHSHEQLTLPNEFLITSSNTQRDDGGGRGLSSIPLFRQLDPVDCDGGPTCPNFDINQQHQSPTTIHQSNIASVPVPAAITPPSSGYHQLRSSPFASLGQPVTWPSSHHVGSIGLLFFVPESASRLPVEQLIRQQLALHRTQFPFDISINCEDAVGSSGCRSDGSGGLSRRQPLQPPPSPSPPPPAITTLIERNPENGNYASVPLVEIDNSSSSRRGSQQHQQQQRKWRTISERLVQNKYQHQNQLQQQQQQQQQQLQQNQRELSTYP